MAFPRMLKKASRTICGVGRNSALWLQDNLAPP